MLKLERTSHDNQVSVSFRDKQKVFTRPFIIALSIALAIHLGLILLFHVSPIKIRWNAGSPLSTSVETDLALTGDSLVLANISQDSLPKNILLSAPAALPKLALTPYFMHVRQVESFEQPRLSLNPFHEIEKAIYQPTFFPTVNLRFSKPISLFITGPLASQTIIDNGLSEALELKTSHSTPQRFTYTVLVDARTGRVFWYEALQEPQDGALKKIAAAMLHNIQFKPLSNLFAIPGQIEVHIKELL